MIGDGNMDHEIATAALILALILTLWALASWGVRARGRSKRGITRQALRIVEERGIAKYRPTLRILPDRSHALIEWTEDGRSRAILLTIHHVLDSEHSHDTQDHYEETEK